MKTVDQVIDLRNKKIHKEFLPKMPIRQAVAHALRVYPKSKDLRRKLAKLLMQRSFQQRAL
jgi:hypothetical protein